MTDPVIRQSRGIGDWDTPELRLKQIERRLNQLGSITWGNQKFQADRISDLLEQIDEVRQEVKQLSERLDKASEAFVKLRREVSNGTSHNPTDGSE